jgi:hypothetical protein
VANTAAPADTAGVANSAGRAERPGAIGTAAAGPEVEADAEPDLWLPPAPLNAVLESLVAVEGVALTRGFSFPFGLSLLAVARAV